MDISKIFGYFSNDPIEDEILGNLENYKDSPHFKIGMFKKLIINGVLFKGKITEYFGNVNDEIDIVDVNAAGQFMIHNRGWFWISQFEYNEEWIEALKKHSDDDLLGALNLSIYYFEEYEEYEKCAFLKKLQNNIEKYLED